MILILYDLDGLNADFDDVYLSVNASHECHDCRWADCDVFRAEKNFSVNHCDIDHNFLPDNYTIIFFLIIDHGSSSGSKF